MRILIVYFTVGLIFMLLQTTLLPMLLPDALLPNLLLILILYLGLSESFIRAMLLCLILGLLQDCFSSTSLGLYGVVNLAIFLQVRMLVTRLSAESPALLLLLVAGGTVVQSFLIGFFLTLFAEAGAVISILMPVLPGQMLVNLLAATVLLGILLYFQPQFGTRSGMARLPHQSRYHGS
ncbi:MAG TPA: rod shape-determining protein MreD [Geopsychrobacteraceae bacterium]|nr:rod shape-determining protein MreD [Geopsychrobacteraceae bacterium]